MDLSTAAGALAFFRNEGYFFMFLIMVAEGPIVTYAAAFVSSLGIFNVFYVFILSLLGNLVGDMILYLIGRFGAKPVIRKFVEGALKTSRVRKIEAFMKKHPGKTISVIKLTPPLPVPGIILTGAMDVPARTFFFYSLVLSLAYSLFFTVLGFYSGIAFHAISAYVQYTEILIGAAVLLAIAIWFLVRYASRKISKRIENI
jgi:membrane protein DedA with SNARE-associated domain